MRAFIVPRYGKNEKLQLAEMAAPGVKENDVLVQIYSAGLNLLDSKLRNGEFKMILPYKTPFTLGHDVAGVVIQTGSKVIKFNVGDKVYARAADHRLGPLQNSFLLMKVM
ncbi:MAG: alcohol dehydrogenase catalytic domain-containing protein [Chitinophagaceae bacterium]